MIRKKQEKYIQIQRVNLHKRRLTVFIDEITFFLSATITKKKRSGDDATTLHAPTRSPRPPPSAHVPPRRCAWVSCLFMRAVCPDRCVRLFTSSRPHLRSGALPGRFPPPPLNPTLPYMHADDGWRRCAGTSVLCGFPRLAYAFFFFALFLSFFSTRNTAPPAFLSVFFAGQCSHRALRHRRTA